MEEKQENSGELQLRMMRDEDIAAVTVLEKAAFSEPWSEAGFADALRQEQSIFLVAEAAQGEIAGYIGLYGSFDEGDITNVAVKETFRGYGLGSRLVDAMKKRAKEQGITQIFLEVRVSNLPAQRLYDKAGFTEIGRRPKFYRNPVEDAILMKVEL